MAFNKAADREGAPMKRRPMHRRKKVCVFCGKDNVIDYKDTSLREEKFFLAESQATVQNTRELLQ